MDEVVEMNELCKFRSEIDLNKLNSDNIRFNLEFELM